MLLHCSVPEGTQWIYSSENMSYRDAFRLREYIQKPKVLRRTKRNSIVLGHDTLFLISGTL